MSSATRTGLDELLRSSTAGLKSARLGLLMNQASVNGRFCYACDLVAECFPGQLRALFSPQHGFWGEVQANMIESPDTVYEPLGLPVYSLYSETRRPTAESLADIDCLLIDLQDVGTRVYTFVWTMLECLRACSEAGVRVVVLDRPNPLGGQIVEGPMLERPYLSFVGGSEIPLRHGLTMGELARLLNAEENIRADLTVVPMSGWKRSMLFPETQLPWVPPSPNMPRWHTALLYPGQVLLEGVSLSEGRGTTTPFELVGAPGLNAAALVQQVGRWRHPGIALQAIHFRPTFDKWKDETCSGLAIHVVDPMQVRSVRLTVTLIEAGFRLAPQQCTWLDPGYEYEFERPPIDILFGSDRLRGRLNSDSPLTADDMDDLLRFDAEQWQQRVAGHLLYE